MNFIQKILRLKTITIVFVFLLVSNAVLQKIFGEVIDNPPIFWVTILFLFYVSIGFAAHLAKAIENRKLYHLTVWFLPIVIVLYLFILFVTDKFPSWIILQNTLFVFLSSILASGIILLLLQVRKMRKSTKEIIPMKKYMITLLASLIIFTFLALIGLGYITQ